jgi:transcriptional regulator with XRE-family HTH domain
MNMGEQIRHARKLKRMTQSDLAVKLGITKQAVSQFEKEQIPISEEIKRKIFKVLLKKDEQQTKSFNNSLGRKIIIARIEQGLSREDLAEKLGISYTALEHYETNARHPKIKTFKKISEILNRPMEYFTNEEKIENTSTPLSSIKFIPVYGEVHAGNPTHGDCPPVQGYVPLPAEILAGKHVAGAFRVNSDSMEPRIKKGQFVLISREQIVGNNDIALVHIRDDGTCVKIVRFEDDKIIIISENKKYEKRTFRADEVNICGKVVGVVNFDI